MLIDDLVTKGTREPYRVMTSRSEYRLLLRQDNADMRLTEIGYEVGLIGEERFAAFLEKRRIIDAEIKRLERTTVPPSDEVNSYLAECGSTAITTGIKLSELLRRPEITYESMAKIDTGRPILPFGVQVTAEVQIKYEGYVKRELAEVARQKKLEEKLIPGDISYKDINGLRLEAIEKLEKIRPTNIGQASRISGVSPADIGVLLIYMSTYKNKGK
jgi:tRNA uridine 5-carboxymethylaminomethyl modification enzyme